jgi:EAL domain-containing protein (putative c-di-GMP-specific phosphodiesterase class I)
VVAGVETEEQSRRLHWIGCDEVQGFFFSRPIPGAVFEAKYLDGRSGMKALKVNI